jgi:glycosyltransferase involved in cell wall biosynthesis
MTGATGSTGAAGLSGPPGPTGATGPTGRRPDRTLRVGVNLLWLVPGVVGGSEEYLVRSLLAVAADPPAPGLDATGLDVTVFGLEALAEAHPELARAFPLVTVPLRGRLRAARIGAESTWLTLEARRRHLDVVHHGGGALPPGHRLGGAASMVTVHDTQPLALPANFSRLKRRWLSWMLPRVARSADVVVTTSDFVRRALVALGAAPGRVLLVPPCPAPPATEPGAPLPDPAEVRGRYGVGERYAVYPAVTYPHKNHLVLVEALARAEAPPDLELVLPGGVGPAEAALAARTRALGLAGRVHRIGRIPRADLEALVTGAVAVAFPSTYEGFGLGALEALGLGAPVVAARAAALPEVVDGAGLLVDPHDPVAWATALAQVSGEDADARRRRVVAGERRAASFSPARTARALVTAWRAAGEAGPGRAADHPR